MVTQTATRRPVAGVVTVLLAAAVLAIAPLNLSAAHAITIVTPSDSTLESLDVVRDAVPLPDFLRNGYVDDFAQLYAANDAACSGCVSPTEPGFALSGESNVTISFAQANGGSLAGRPLRMADDFEAFDSTAVHSANNYAAVGFVTKGSDSYAVLVTMNFASTPNNEIRVGTVTFPSKEQVGVAVVPTIKGFNPLPTSGYGFTWIDGATDVGFGSTYTPTSADLGKQLKVIVSDVATGYATNQVTSALSHKVVIGAVHGPATIYVGGARNAGEPLAVDTGGWTPVSPTIQWYRNGVKIPGATGDTYVQVAADRGKRIDVRLTDAAPGYVTGSKITADKVLTGYPLLTETPFPTITGSPSIGQTVTVNPGTWGPGTVALKYQWRANGVAIPGATHTTLYLGGSLLEASVSVTVTGSEADFAWVARTSSPMPDVQPLGFSTVVNPTITGIEAVGGTMHATITPSWSPAVTMYVYQWYRGLTPIKNATSSSYKAVAADSGNAVWVQVIGFRADYKPVMVHSATVLVQP